MIKKTITITIDQERLKELVKEAVTECMDHKVTSYVVSSDTE